jgi:hypothetical protein
MASFKSILSDVGNGLKKFFGVSVTVAQDVEPLVDIVFPGIAGLYNATVAEAVKAEALAVAAGTQSGTGAQKLALVVAAVTPSVIAYAAANGLPAPTSSVITNWINAIVASLNSIPSK